MDFCRQRRWRGVPGVSSPHNHRKSGDSMRFATFSLLLLVGTNALGRPRPPGGPGPAGTFRKSRRPRQGASRATFQATRGSARHWSTHRLAYAAGEAQSATPAVSLPARLRGDGPVPRQHYELADGYRPRDQRRQICRNVLVVMPDAYIPVRRLDVFQLGDHGQLGGLRCAGPGQLHRYALSNYRQARVPRDFPDTPWAATAPCDIGMKYPDTFGGAGTP